MYTSIQVQCSLLATFYSQAENELTYNENVEMVGFAQVAEWLEVAAGVQNIGYCHNQHDVCSSMYCSQAAYYDAKKSEIVETLLKELVVFNFIWGAFETFVKIVFDKSLLRRKGKINSIAEFLKGQSEERLGVVGYNSFLQELVENVLMHSKYDEYYKVNCESMSQYGRVGLGLLLVYGIRNKFAHGTLLIPEHQEFSGLQHVDHEIISLSSRVILLIMQMITILKYTKVSFYVWSSGYEEGFYEDVEMHYFLKYLHLRKGVICCEQYKLLDI